MEFISLGEALANIADCVQLEPHLDDKAEAIGVISKAAADKFLQDNNLKIEWARQSGVAAFALNKALHDSDAPPQWMAFDDGKRFAVRSDAARQEGIELLTHATGWGNREQHNCSRHFFNAITQGNDALSMPVIPDANNGQTPDGRMLRLLQVGFDRAKLVAFLDSNQIDHDLMPKDATPSPAPEPQAAPVSDEPWKKQARTRAYEIIKRDKEKDLYPSQVDIADEIAKQFRGDGLTGVDGKPLTGAYIKRHSLKGISSAQSKLVSTVMRQSK